MREKETKRSDRQPDGRTSKKKPMRKDAILFVRATPEEKRRIVARTNAAGLSVSRYLVRAALEGQPPSTREERARLEALLYLLKRSALAVGALRLNLAGMRLAGANPTVMEELEEAERVLKRLYGEVGRRL